jgi:hypothetical protein
MSSATRTRSFTEKLGLLRELALFEGVSEADTDAIGHAPDDPLRPRPADPVT